MLRRLPKFSSITRGYPTFRRFASTDNSNSYTPAPLTFEIDDEMRQLLNCEWYWRNRERFVQDKELFEHFVLFDNGNVVKVFDKYNDASRFQSRHPYCFLTFVGDEHYPQNSIITLPGKDSDILLKEGDVISPPHLENVPITEFKKNSKFYGPNERPYLLLGLCDPQKPTIVLPTWFLVDTSSPSTHIEEKTCSALFGYVKTAPRFRVGLLGHPVDVPVSLSSGIAKEINLLGTDVCWDHLLQFHRKEETIYLGKPNEM
eukprot:TRINITY_DN22549_c0_g1_i1.p1 TRINITY_DN22549_c0_g1~~TRINITY_DN22549_c0_g1_i1.p1  ORF type:complete len:259 (-),score=3.06 TRINITY_DN22549_c0_g1_i1:35-811(-)